MNRVTISKYKEEFLYWMSEGWIYGRKENSNDEWEKFEDGNKKLFKHGYEFSKTNEKTFKSGDFVRVSGSPGKIISIKQKYATIQLLGSRVSKTEDFIESWKPVPEEVCFFWNGADQDIILSKLLKEENGKYQAKNKNWYKNIVPLIGIEPRKDF